VEYIEEESRKACKVTPIIRMIFDNNAKDKWVTVKELHGKQFRIANERKD
jgi:hypothetical protein